MADFEVKLILKFFSVKLIKILLVSYFIVYYTPYHSALHITRPPPTSPSFSQELRL